MLNIIQLENSSHFAFVQNSNILCFGNGAFILRKKKGNKIEALKGKVEDAFIPFRVKGNVHPRTGHDGPGGE